MAAAAERTQKTHWTPKRRAAFLASLKEHGNVRSACQAAGVSRSSVYFKRETDKDFAAAWDEAMEEACDLLEASARTRAFEGSDTLLIFLLKAHRPEKFRETVRQEHSGEQRLVVEYKRNWRGHSGHGGTEEGAADAS